MQPVPNTPFAPPYVPALGLRGEKPHQGVRNKNPAPYRGHNRCNFRTALGLRKGQCQNRVRSRCSGEQYDSDLGLYYLRARYYNTMTGRFVSRDPENGVPNTPKTLHKYAYAGGDPINAADPTGHETLTKYAAIVAITATTSAAVACVGIAALHEYYADRKAMACIALCSTSASWDKGLCVAACTGGAPTSPTCHIPGLGGGTGGGGK